MSINNAQSDADSTTEQEMIVKRYKTMPIDMDWNYPVAGRSVGIAPHTIHAVGCFHMRINRYCVVTSRIIANEPPERVQDHIIVIKEYMDVDYVRNRIWELLRIMKLRRTYEMEITGEHDLNGQVALLPILVSIWASLGKIELDDFKKEQDWGDFDKFDKLVLNNEGVCSAFEATISETSEDETMFYFDLVEEYKYMDMVGVPSFNNDIRSRWPDEADSGKFHSTFDFVFGRTNLHPSKFKPHLSWNIDGVNRKEVVMRDLMDEKFSILSTMKHFSEKRLDNRTYLEPLQIERECQTAFSSMEDFNKNSVLKGYEVQQGGFLIVLKKHEFKSDDWWKTIVNQLSAHIKNGNLQKIEFHLLNTGIRCGTFPIKSELELNQHFVVTLNKQM